MSDERKTAKCPACMRQVTVDKDGKLATHGPGRGGSFICDGSGDKAMVKAAKHLNVNDAK